MAIQETEYKVGHYVVYPTHGVGKIIATENQQVGGVELLLFVITFEKDRMTLRVPVKRANAAGLRHLSNKDEVVRAFDTLKKKAKASKGMWSRRAKDYEAKINSGNIVSLAEVVRDLHRNVEQPERSYSERIIYESALDRFTGEIAAIEQIDTRDAVTKVVEFLRKEAA